MTLDILSEKSGESEEADGGFCALWNVVLREMERGCYAEWNVMLREMEDSHVTGEEICEDL